MKRTVQSSDGVRIVYQVGGDAEPTLVFIHGGLADRSFWDTQMEAFRNDHRVIALDLAGHGESGADRPHWSIAAFAADVRSAAEAENAERIVLIGNSLGGPVAVEASLMLPGRTLGVVGVDTFHDLSRKVSPEEMRARIEAAQSDYPAFVQQMISGLFHPDADRALLNDLRRRMLRTPEAVAVDMLGSFAGYDLAGSVRRMTAPLRCINGDLYPVEWDLNRRIAPDFEGAILPHTGHYPMLEDPAAFNLNLKKIVDGFADPPR